MNFGFIGIGNQAKQIINILEKNFQDIKFTVFAHRENLSIPERYNKAISLDELCSCDAIFIMSPNDTHYNYIKYYIENFKGYIFVEKPPVTDLEALEYLSSISDEDKKRIYFNFNYRHSDYMQDFMNDAKKYNLGNLVSATILQGHGLAFKPEYKNNWRSRKETHKRGVFETYSVHFIDMFITLFGKPKKTYEIASNRSENGTSIDNSMFVAQFDNDVTLNITTSYTCPAINRLTLIYENGFVEYGKNKLIYSPRDCFDKNGRFVTPKITAEEHINPDLYKNSLEKSVLFFMDIIKAGIGFDVNLFSSSIETNRLLID